ncbi:hypothetical protein B0H19DRAFT_1059757 [Mycena capillaripes]|nr:hypothetical protein B0H19DRAFT_1059757 [Mycena capillaripes]
MTSRRPPLKQTQNRSSQIYIGTGSPYSSYLSSPPDIPDLPEPPSPGSSSSTSTSGLPSPPATNSTGSGSTGDPGSIAVRGGLNMLNGSNIKTFHAAFHAADHHHDEQDDYDNDNDDDGEDNTARLDHQRRHSTSENVLALQRVKSLTQRNKMALDKLSSFSRLSSPSPTTRPASVTRSPQPPAPPSILASSSSSSASHSTSSHSSSSHSHSSSRPSIRRARTQDHQSGSETERDDVPTPSPNRPTTPLPPTRQRLVSAPASPQKHLRVTAASTSSGSASASGSSATRSPRRVTTRISHLSFSSSSAGDEDGGDPPSSPEDITRAALAAVASARRSPLGNTNTATARYTGGPRMSPTSASGGKRRQPLPREWGASSSSSNGRFSAEPPTSPPTHQISPNKRHSLAGSTASSTTQHSRGHSHSNSTSSTSTIGSTVYGRAGERASTVRELARRHQARWLSEDMGSGSGSVNGNGEVERERRQSLRAGSAESALGVGGRSLVGEGLRAAGLAGRSAGGGDVFSPQEREQPQRTPARVEWAEGTQSRSQSRLGHGRAATSMAEYTTSARRREEEMGGYVYDTRDDRDGNGDDRDEPRTAPPLRTYRSSAYVLDARAGSALGRYRDRGVSVERERDREGGAPRARRRRRRRGDLARSAQALVGAAERLNAILRAGTARALEEQIDAEVSGVDRGAGAAEVAEVWRRVGGEYREGLRVSDELVRGVTGFLLGVGKVVRDFGEGRGSDEGRASASPDTAAGRDGRRSVESRRSVDRDRDDRRISAGGRESALGVRPSSVLNARHEPAPPSGPRNVTPSSRRLLTPREQRELHASGGIVASDSQETVQPGPAHGYEPSPTPASRKQNQTTLERSRTLPPIAIPKPLPTLPSESASTLRRNQTTGDKPAGFSSQRRRTLTSSTVRAGGSGLLPSMTTPTTALTPHTVSNSPHERGDTRMAFPVLPRTESDKSVPTRSRNNTVTFSRPSTVALAGLQMQHERERQRTSSNTNGPLDDLRVATAAAGPSGSETEKDTRKRSSVATRDRPRMSLDGGVDSIGAGHAADRSAAAGLSVAPGGLNQKRERRRTVTDIWPPSES